MSLTFLLILSFVTGGLGALIIMKLGPRIGINDIPNKRSSHVSIVPKGGGIGILAAFCICAIFLNLPASFWIPCLLISFMSLWGDRYEISPVIRLCIQFCCSLLFCSGLNFGFFSIPLSIFLTGTANFYNFMDGIDGMAGITGVAGFSLLAVYSFLIGDFETYGSLSISIALSCAGFLVFNIPRAKVFMGDVGSILLGFVFSGLVILLSENAFDFFIMTGFLFPFYFDELLTIIIRLKKRESLLKPHRRHIYQLLANEMEISHWKISVVYGILQLIIGFTLISLRSNGFTLIYCVYLVYGTVLLLLSFFIHRMVYLK